MIYFLLTEHTVEFLSVHPLMLKTLISHQGDALIATINAVESVFRVSAARH
jgi:hypothetical protein